VLVCLLCTMSRECAQVGYSIVDNDGCNCQACAVIALATSFVETL
jgi:hypothetical protein